MTEHELGVLLRLLGLRPRRLGGQWLCLCPAHDDHVPSLTARATSEGKVLVCCHAGCAGRSVMAALGLLGHACEQRFSAPRARRVEPPDPGVAREWAAIAGADSNGQVEEHERELGIPGSGLRRLGAVWSGRHAALAVPMYDRIGGQLVGVRLRYDDGRKRALRGSHNGLFAPPACGDRGALFLPEGMTDTAALLGLGLDAVGRPSCNGGRELVRAALRGTRRLIVVVTDADEPGRRGAELLASELVADGVRVKIVGPPPGKKDVRESIRAGVTAAALNYMVRSTACCKGQ